MLVLLLTLLTFHWALLAAWRPRRRAFLRAGSASGSHPPRSTPRRGGAGRWWRRPSRATATGSSSGNKRAGAARRRSRGHHFRCSPVGGRPLPPPHGAPLRLLGDRCAGALVALGGAAEGNGFGVDAPWLARLVRRRRAGGARLAGGAAGGGRHAVGRPAKARRGVAVGADRRLRPGARSGVPGLPGAEHPAIAPFTSLVAGWAMSRAGAGSCAAGRQGVAGRAAHRPVVAMRRSASPAARWFSSRRRRSTRAPCRPPGTPQPPCSRCA